MKNRKLLPFVLAGIFLLSMLAFLSAAAKLKGYQDLMLVVPYEFGISDYDLQEIEELCRDGFDITYEMKESALAQAAGSNHPVTLIGTNPAYRRVLNLRLTTGSFFSEAAWRMGSHHAVLSESAAFHLFGSYDIIGSTVMLGGESFLVTGVVKDQVKKEAAFYIPSGLLAGTVQVLMLRTSAGTGEIRNRLIRLGIYEDNTRLLNLAKMAAVYEQLFFVGVSMYLILCLLSFAAGRTDRLTEFYQVAKLRHKIMYLSKLVKESRNDLPGIIYQLVLLISSLSAICLLAGRILFMILPWKALLKAFNYLPGGVFQSKIQWLHRYFSCGPVLFFLFLLVFFCLIGLNLKRMKLK
ncbi:MAG: ABC transporter permease [Lachnospiraceae bacterium]